MKITNNTIKERASLLKSSKDEFNNLIQKMMIADNKNLFGVDLLCVGIANRSNLLIAGFCNELLNKNFLSASSLIRLHLDSLLQLYGIWLVDKPHDFAVYKIHGNKTGNFKDRNGKKMTDFYLREKFFTDDNNKEFLNLIDVYNETSGFVHFSDKHIFSSITSENNGNFKIILSDKMEHIPLDKEYEAIECMLSITKGIFKYISSWVYTKDNVKK